MHITLHRRPADLYGELDEIKQNNEKYGPAGQYRLSGKTLVDTKPADRIESLRTDPRYCNSVAVQRMINGETLTDIADKMQTTRNPWAYGRKRKDYNMGVDGLSMLVKDACTLRVSPILSPRRPTTLAAYSAMLGLGVYEALQYLSSHEMIPQHLSDDASWLGASTLVVAGIGYVFSRMRRKRKIKEIAEKVRYIDAFYYPFGTFRDVSDDSILYKNTDEANGDLSAPLQDVCGGAEQELELRPTHA